MYCVRRKLRPHDALVPLRARLCSRRVPAAVVHQASGGKLGSGKLLLSYEVRLTRKSERCVQCTS